MHTLLSITIGRNDPVNVSSTVRKPFTRACEQGAVHRPLCLAFSLRKCTGTWLSLPQLSCRRRNTQVKPFLPGKESTVLSRQSKKDEDRGCDMPRRFSPQAANWGEINTQSLSKQQSCSNIILISLLSGVLHEQNKPLH